jgi:predicted component of type VI protein secretion system
VSAQVIELVSEATVDQAWSDYTAYARQLSEDHTKLTDRAFHEEFTRRYERWRKLFMMQEAGR